MSVSDVIAKIVSFLWAGYSQGVPATYTFAVLALLHRRCRRSSCHSFVPPGFTASLALRMMLRSNSISAVESSSAKFRAPSRAALRSDGSTSAGVSS